MARYRVENAYPAHTLTFESQCQRYEARRDQMVMLAHGLHLRVQGTWAEPGRALITVMGNTNDLDALEDEIAHLDDDEEDDGSSEEAEQAMIERMQQVNAEDIADGQWPRYPSEY